MNIEKLLEEAMLASFSKSKEIKINDLQLNDHIKITTHRGFIFIGNWKNHHFSFDFDSSIMEYLIIVDDINHAELYISVDSIEKIEKL